VRGLAPPEAGLALGAGLAPEQEGHPVGPGGVAGVAMAVPGVQARVQARLRASSLRAPRVPA